jgi:hypothetical protein
MPYSIEVVGFCPQYHSLWRVQGSKPGTAWTITLNGAEHAPFYNCPAFRYSGPIGEQNCKHVSMIWKHGCLWNPQWHDAGPNDWSEHGIELVDTNTRFQFDELCKGGCGGKMIATKIAV